MYSLRLPKNSFERVEVICILIEYICMATRERKYTEQFTIRVTPEQRQTSEKLARESGIELMDWVRFAINEKIQRDLETHEMCGDHENIDCIAQLLTMLDDPRVCKKIHLIATRGERE